MDSTDFADGLAGLVTDLHAACGLWLTWKDADPLVWQALPEAVRVHHHPLCLTIKARPADLGRCMDWEDPERVQHAGCRLERCPFGVCELREALWQHDKCCGFLCLGAWRQGPRPRDLPAYDAASAGAAFRLARAQMTALLELRAAGRGALRPGLCADPVIERALAIIETRLHAGLRVAEIAAQVGLSPSRIAHRFRAGCGVSFGRYLQERLMCEGARLLARPGASVLRVALDLGYGSPDHFAALFRRHSGLAPSVFMRRARVRRP